MNDLLNDLDNLVHQYKFREIPDSYPNDIVGCIGWFADSSNGKSIGVRLGILASYDPYSMYPYEMKDYGYFSQFRPAKPSEVKFYAKA